MNKNNILKTSKVTVRKAKPKLKKKLDKEAVEAKTKLDTDDPEFVNNLIKLYEREKQSRCYFQLERDKLTNIVTIEREKSQSLKQAVDEANLKLYDFEQWHLSQVSHLNRKLKYLTYDKACHIQDLTLELESKASECLKDGVDDRRLYLTGIRDRLNELNEERTNYDDLLKNIMLKNANKIDEIETEHTEMLINVHKTCQARFATERESLLLMNRNMVHEISEVKNEQIAETREIMNKGFEEMKYYFATLTKSLILKLKVFSDENRGYIKKFKEMEVESKKRQVHFDEIKSENEKLKSTVKNLTTQANLYVTNKRIFQVKDLDFKGLSKNFKDLDLKHEALVQAHENLKKENTQLNEYIDYLIRKFKEKIETLNLISYKKIKIESRRSSFRL
jgi:hypothetical protein